jgi:hypothetical protein
MVDVRTERSLGAASACAAGGATTLGVAAGGGGVAAGGWDGVGVTGAGRSGSSFKGSM